MAFQGKYVRASYIGAKRREFLNLTLRDRSVAKYERERDCSALVEKMKIVEEVKGTERQNRDRGKSKRDLEPSYSRMRPKKKARSDGLVKVGPPAAPTGVALCGHCDRCHLGKCWRTTGACLRCGSTEHRVRDYPLRTDQMKALVTRTTQSLRVVQQRPRGRGQARGDIGSTHSYVASTVSETLEMLVENTDSEVTVLSPLGQSVLISRVYRDVLLEVQGTTFLADLMKLPFGEFNLILGMDWLIKHQVSLDCTTKRVVLRTDEDNEVVVIGERRDYLNNVISALAAEKLVRKGCEAFLTYISISDSGDSLVKDIRTVRDFPDVFPEELPRLPPSQEVEFGIQLVPSTALGSIALYRMTLKELTKLNVQIQELLDPGFIHSSVSP
ncbi:uncharacterized protein [Gossypium hirsutum]|uniref:Gag protease polyprotein-like protein n=1 Tax=Gossypium hirsutum TaxID=3635 RepID=A0ABM3BWD8_GOSHI|nr:uncharacterized protein LOC121230532 [Gossypium hirsutum]